jgi:hypothetical protein
MPTRWRWPPESASARWLREPGQAHLVEQLEGAIDVGLRKRRSQAFQAGT